MSGVSVVRAQCENGHGQDLVFTEGGDPDVTRFHTKGGTHPVFFEGGPNLAQRVLELQRMLGAACGLCGGKLTWTMERDGRGVDP